MSPGQAGAVSPSANDIIDALATYRINGINVLCGTAGDMADNLLGQAHGVLCTLTAAMEQGELNLTAQQQCARGLETLIGLAAFAVEAMPR